MNRLIKLRTPSLQTQRAMRLRWLLLPLGGLALSVQAEDLNAVRVNQTGPLKDPSAAYWQSAPVAAVPTTPQVVTTPTKPDAAVSNLQVRAAHNGEWIGFLLEWKDATASKRIVVDQFGDQVAVELPARLNKGSTPSPMMGNPGGRVSILQWRAAFQQDIEQGDPTTRGLYPNALIDVYPDQVLRATDAQPYMGALGMDNPISHAKRTPVLDQMAEGWGTMTVKPEQHADGRGVWSDGIWRVAITHPLNTESESDPDLAVGADSLAAFAVWDGGSAEVGSRKAWSAWVPMHLAK